MARDLNEKQMAFAREYVHDFNATQAAIRAGYSKKTAGSLGFDLLKKAEIQQEISAIIEKAKQNTEVTVERVLAELSAIAFVDPAELFNDDGSLKPLSQIPESARRAIAGIETKTVTDGRGDDVETSQITKLKTWDKGANLERLGKYLKMFVDGKSIELPKDASFTMVVHGRTDAD